MQPNLEDAGRIALRAASAGNLDELRAALAAREKALADLCAAEPAESVHARMIIAQEIGDAIAVEIRSLKRRLVTESTRLGQLRTYRM
jgi:hypothetical protein